MSGVSEVGAEDSLAVVHVTQLFAKRCWKVSSLPTCCTGPAGREGRGEGGAAGGASAELPARWRSAK